MVQLESVSRSLSPVPFRNKQDFSGSLSPQFCGKRPLQSNGQRQKSGWAKSLGKYLMVSLASIGATLGVQSMIAKPQPPQVVMGEPTLADDCGPELPGPFEPIPMPEPIEVSLLPVASGSPEEASVWRKIHQRHRTDAGFTVFNQTDNFVPFEVP